MKPNDKHSSLQLGIWTIVTNRTPLVPAWLSDCPKFFGQFWTRSISLLCPREEGINKNKKIGIEGPKAFPGFRTIAYLYVFMKEICAIAPIYFVIEILLCLWKTTSRTLELYYSNRLLSAITHSLQSGQVESYPIMKALAYKVLVAFLLDYIPETGNTYTNILRERVKYHFLEREMHSLLRFDLSKSEDSEVRDKVERTSEHLLYYRTEAWHAFYELLDSATYVATIVSELSVMVRVASSSSTFILAIVSGLVHPILTEFGYDIYSRAFVVFCNNPHYRRMESLYRLAFSDVFQVDRINNNLGQYIEREFKNNRMALRDTDTEYPMMQWRRHRRKYVVMLSKLASDTSLIVLAFRILWDPNSVALDDLVLIQQTSDAVRSSMYRLLYRSQRISEHFRNIKIIYSLAEVENKIKDGDVPYPLHSEGKNHSGAEVEFRNVSFRYPGKDTHALSDVSFTIKPGQLVVIVGVNGSGKTSTIKLLSRLYDPTGGEILMDGRPLSSYRLEDIRRATAILRQEHPILPLSLRENIALGLPERTVSDKEIGEAMGHGGAAGFVHKLKHGLETELSPVNITFTNFVNGRDTDRDLKAVVDEKEVKTDLSGGETQRLSASRTFMKLMGGNVRLLVADEPTSALDPQGEYELFKKLREHSGGKTVIFITHRFGHLTKYADLIMCLKDGRLIEQGNHETLMGLDGEYKKLYDVQAGAFGA